MLNAKQIRALRSLFSASEAVSVTIFAQGTPVEIEKLETGKHAVTFYTIVPCDEGDTESGPLVIGTEIIPFQTGICDTVDTAIEMVLEYEQKAQRIVSEIHR